ncbi:GFA family protein [Dasania marina]|uniref:GFA family protein n=1 Tax=Dasania marina TaxID=471499 RepID=UPI000374C803|nr:GFA family protein [Dasania marina]
MSLTGSCLCGAIAYQASAINNTISHCHCQMCRKFHGAAFASYGSIAPANFKWLRGEQALKSYTASNGTIRQFCQHCGSSLTFTSKSQPTIELALGSLDVDITQRPVAHIFTAYKANWYSITDGLPCFAEDADE